MAPDHNLTTVLCIEDNASNLRLMERIFALRPAAHLLTATEGAAGLDLAREHQPELVILDLNLPDLAGDEVLGQLRANPGTHDTPVIVVSADATRPQIERTRAAGATGYMTKPLQVQKVLEAVDSYLEAAAMNGP